MSDLKSLDGNRFRGGGKRGRRIPPRTLTAMRKVSKRDWKEDGAPPLELVAAQFMKEDPKSYFTTFAILEKAWLVYLSKGKPAPNEPEEVPEPADLTGLEDDREPLDLTGLE
jgi:hypothetical protein